MDLELAKKYVIANPDAYGWQHSYTQWLPLHCISDFADIIPPVKPLAAIPQKIVDEFNQTIRNIAKQQKDVNAEIATNEEIAQAFAQEIESYKKITQQLSPEVQANINSIEQQYDVLQQKLKKLKEHTDVTANEVTKVVSSFNLITANKSILPPNTDVQNRSSKQESTPTPVTKPVIKAEPQQAVTQKPATVVAEPAAKADDKQAIAQKAETTTEPAAKADDKQAIAQKTETTAEESSNGQVVNIRPIRPPGAKVISTRSKKPGGAHAIDVSHIIEKQTETATENKTTEQTAPSSSNKDDSQEHPDKIKDKIGAGVKNIFSSMFGNETAAPPISSGLKDLVNKEEVKTEQPTEIKNSAEEEHEEIATKRKRRRRR